jgi:hypothetical protein
MSLFNRVKISTAVIAALMAGVVLVGGDAHAKAKAGNGGPGNGTVASGAPAESAKKTPPYSCWACKFVKRDKDVSKSGDKHDKPGNDMSSKHHGHDKYKKDRVKLTCKGFVGCPKLPYPGGTTASVPPTSPKPVPPTTTSGPAPVPAPMPPTPVVRDHRPGGNGSQVTVTNPRHESGVLDTVGGAIKDVGGAIKDAGKAIITVGSPTPGSAGAGGGSSSTKTQY